MTEPQTAPHASLQDHIAATKYWYDAADERRIERDQLRKRLKAITEATILWRDRTAGDVGLAIALTGILDADKPESPATAAVARVRKLHQPMQRGAITTCRECSGWDGHRCRGVVSPYPCATISALENQ
ncbi:hypothetical protein [Streptomyces sp. NPDC058108]|uniref:hypothetical protein n=1 Tax=Streptomyces sp. NPDC058108 TaxID=3346344 RepID=UPI0036EEE421